MKQEKKQSEEDNKEVMKKFNFNKFGRYNGGVPAKIGFTRGGALAKPGEFVSAEQMHEIRGAGTSVDLYTNREDVRANTNYVKSDIDFLQFKKTYFQANVENKTLFNLKFLTYIFIILVVLKIIVSDITKQTQNNFWRKYRLTKKVNKGNVTISDDFIFKK